MIQHRYLNPPLARDLLGEGIARVGVPGDAHARVGGEHALNPPGGLGRCRLHAPDGSFEEAGPGEAIYIAPGFEGAFEVLETLTKTYMIID